MPLSNKYSLQCGHLCATDGEFSISSHSPTDELSRLRPIRELNCEIIRKWMPGPDTGLLRSTYLPVRAFLICSTGSQAALLGILPFFGRNGSKLALGTLGHLLGITVSNLSTNMITDNRLLLLEHFSTSGRQPLALTLTKSYLVLAKIKCKNLRLSYSNHCLRFWTL